MSYIFTPTRLHNTTSSTKCANPRRSHSYPRVSASSRGGVSSVLASAFSEPSSLACCVPLDHFNDSVPSEETTASSTERGHHFRQYNSMPPATPESSSSSPHRLLRRNKQRRESQMDSSDGVLRMDDKSTLSKSSSLSSLSSSFHKKVAPIFSSSPFKPSKYFNTVGWVETSSNDSPLDGDDDDDFDSTNSVKARKDDDESNDSSSTPKITNTSRNSNRGIKAQRIARTRFSHNDDHDAKRGRKSRRRLLQGGGGIKGGGVLFREFFLSKRKKKSKSTEEPPTVDLVDHGQPSTQRKKHVSFAPVESNQYYVYETESMSNSSNEDSASDDDQGSMTTNVPIDDRQKQHETDSKPPNGPVLSSSTRPNNHSGSVAKKKPSRSSSVSKTSDVTSSTSSKPTSSSASSGKRHYHVDVQKLNRWLLQARYNRQMNRWNKYDWETIAKCGVKSQVVLSPGYPGTGNENTSVRNHNSNSSRGSGGGSMIHKMKPKKRRRAGASRLGWQITLANVTCVLDYEMSTLLDCHLRPSTASAGSWTRSGSSPTSPVATAIYPAVVSPSMQQRHEDDAKLLKKDPNMVTTHTIVVLVNDLDDKDMTRGGDHLTTVYGILARDLIAEELYKNHGSSAHTSDVVTVIEHLGNDTNSGSSIPWRQELHQSQPQDVVFNRRPLDWTLYNDLLKRASQMTREDSEKLKSGSECAPSRCTMGRSQDLVCGAMESVLKTIHMDLERLGARYRRSGKQESPNTEASDEDNWQWINVNGSEIPAYAVMFVLCSSVGTKIHLRQEEKPDGMANPQTANSRAKKTQTAFAHQNSSVGGAPPHGAFTEAKTREIRKTDLYVSVQRLAQLLQWKLTLWGIKIDIPSMSPPAKSKPTESESAAPGLMSGPVFSSYCASSMGASSPTSNATPTTATTNSLSSSSLHSTSSSISSSSLNASMPSSHWKTLQSMIKVAKSCHARGLVGTGECNVNYISGIASKFSVTLSSLRKRILSSASQEKSGYTDGDDEFQPFVISTIPYRYNNQSSFQPGSEGTPCSENMTQESSNEERSSTISSLSMSSFSNQDDVALEWKQTPFTYVSAIGLEIQMEPINEKGLYLVYEVDEYGQALGQPMATKRLYQNLYQAPCGSMPTRIVRPHESIEDFYTYQGRIHSMACYLAGIFSKWIATVVSRAAPNGEISNVSPPRLEFAPYKLHRPAKQSNDEIGSFSDVLWVEEFLHGRYTKFTRSFVRRQDDRQTKVEGLSEDNITSDSSRNDSAKQRFPTVTKFFPKPLSGSLASSLLGNKSESRSHMGGRSPEEKKNDLGDSSTISVSDWVEAFSHWTYEYTHHELLICDLRGVVVAAGDDDSESNTNQDGDSVDGAIEDGKVTHRGHGQERGDGGEKVEDDGINSCDSLPPPHVTTTSSKSGPTSRTVVKMTCPSICSVPQQHSTTAWSQTGKSNGRYGPQDGGYNGLRRFRRDHCCNKACLLLGLDK